MKDYLLITGATSDLGMALAHRVQDDYALILSGRNIKALDSLATSLNEPKRHAILPLDMAEFGSCVSELKSVLGSETAGFASGEALSVPSVARSVKRDRSEAKSAEGTKTNGGGGQHICS